MKLSAEQMKHVLRPGVRILSDIFARHDYEIRVAGGAVRDLLLGKIPKDLDFATTATPNDMKKMFQIEEVRIINLNGEKHGTITARIEEENFECTTLRIDKITDGRHAQVEFIRNWELDAGRRDLTVNALFLGLDGTIYDYFEGVKHLKNNIIKFVGDPDKRMQEDYLRILRYFRFFGQLAIDQSKHDPEVLSSIQRNCEGLSKISGERIWIELKKILLCKYSSKLFQKMCDCGVGVYIGLFADFDCNNMSKVYNNLKNLEYQPCTILAAGFSSEEDASVFISRIKCSNKEKENLLFIIKNRNLFSNLNTIKTVQDILVDMVYKEKKGKDLVLQLAAELFKYVGRDDLLCEIDNNLIPHFPIKGGMLVNKVQKKNQIQKEMKRLLDLWKTSNYSLNREELLTAVETYQ